MYRIYGLSSDTKVSQSVGIVLKTFEKLDVEEDTENVEDSHKLKPKSYSKRIIIEPSKSKDSDKIRAVK